MNIKFLALLLVAMIGMSAALSTQERLSQKLRLRESSDTAEDEESSEDATTEESSEDAADEESSEDAADEESSEEGEDAAKTVAATELKGEESSECNSGCSQVQQQQQQDPNQKIDDAVEPVAQWIKDFKKRTQGNGADLYAAARATVKPLLNKLKRNQERAQAKLEAADESIRRHVEEQAVDHVYSLLKAAKTKEQLEEEKEAKKEQQEEAKEKAEEAKEMQKLADENSESTKKDE